MASLTTPHGAARKAPRTPPPTALIVGQPAKRRAKPHGTLPGWTRRRSAAMRLGATDRRGPRGQAPPGSRLRGLDAAAQTAQWKRVAGPVPKAVEGQGPPAPPIRLTPLVACDPDTDMDVLWHIAREAPELRRWLAANPTADAALLEYVAQRGGPGVKAALTVLLES